MKIRHLLSSLLLVQLVAACGSDTPSGSDQPATSTRPENPTYNFGGTAQLRPETVVLPAAATDNVTVSDNKLVFPKTGNEWMLTLPAGTPLAGERRKNVFTSNNAFGVLRKTRSVHDDGGTITVETEPATLQDIITGDFEVSTPDGQVTFINPVGSDYDKFFPGWGAVDPTTCGDDGLCIPLPDDGSGPPSDPAPSPGYAYKPVNPLAIAADLPGDPREALKAQILAAGPDYLESVLTDLLAWSSQVREVREKGIAAYSESDLKKLFAISVHNLEMQDNPKAAASMKALGDYLLGPNGLALRKAMTTGDWGSAPGLAPQGFWDVVSSPFRAVVDFVVDTIADLLSVDATVRIDSIGLRKEKAFNLQFLDIKDAKKNLGSNVSVSLSASANAMVWAYLSPSAHVKGSFVKGVEFSAWLQGEIGAGAIAKAAAEVTLASEFPDDKDEDVAEELAKNPEKSKSPWRKKILAIGPIGGPSIGPVPTTFQVDVYLKCDWELKAKVDAEAEAALKTTAKLGAEYKNGNWSKISEFTWEKTFQTKLTMGGGATLRCGAEPQVSWLVGGLAGPSISAFGGLKAELSYEESCDEAKTSSPDVAVDFGLSAFVDVGVGGKIQFLDLDLAEIGPLKIFGDEWSLYSKKWEFDGAGFGFCSSSCGAFGDDCCVGSTCTGGLTCNTSVGKCNCASGVSCGGACCDSGELCSNNKCVQPALACAQFKAPSNTVLNAGCAANNTCPASCRSVTSGSGYYLVKPSSAGPAFQVLCDMNLDGGGWTLVGYEPAGNPNPSNATGIMAQLSKESTGVDPIALSKLTSGGFIGPRFSYPLNYSEARLAWCPDDKTLKYQRFTTTADLFANTLANQPNATSAGAPLSGPNQMVKLTNFSSNDAALLALLKNTDDAAFCRAYAGSLIPGDTSWGVKQRAESSNECGCNGQSWAGTGSYYGGKGGGGNNDACTAQGGGWAGTAGNGVQKGGINTNALYFWVR